MESRRQQYLQDMVDHGNQRFDPPAGMLRGLPPDESSHPVTPSLCYALALLELSERALLGRAENIISRVIDLQKNENIPDRAGLWLSCPKGKTTGPADCAATSANARLLVYIWCRHRRRLDRSLVERITDALRLAASRIQLDSTNAHHEPTVFQGIFVMVATAEITANDGLLTHALACLKTSCQDTIGASFGNPIEDMTAVLASLHAIQTYAHDSTAQTSASRLLERAWPRLADLLDETLAQTTINGSHADTALCIPALLQAMTERSRNFNPAGSTCLFSKDEPFSIIDACVLKIEAPREAIRSVAANVNRDHTISVRRPCTQMLHRQPAKWIGSS